MLAVTNVYEGPDKEMVSNWCRAADQTHCKGAAQRVKPYFCVGKDFAGTKLTLDEHSSSCSTQFKNQSTCRDVDEWKHVGVRICTKKVRGCHQRAFIGDERLLWALQLK